MKRFLAAMAACALCLGILAGCSETQSPQASESAGNTDTVSVVCATFPAYDWVVQIAGDKADQLEITYLMDNGVDLHSYEPSVEDIAKIADCDLFVYVGGESDSWAHDALEAAGADAPHSVNMMEVVGDAAVEEEVVEGMQAEEEHAHEHGDEAEDEHAHEDGDEAEEAEEEHAHEHEGEEPEYDEHVWLSLVNAQSIVKAIATELAAVDADNADAYLMNAEAYNRQLGELDDRFAETVKDAAKDTVLFGDRFPFRYLVDDYGLKYYAAFVGCSAETEASFETVAFLAKKVDELGLGAVLVIENSDEEIAKTIIASTESKDQKILVMDSLQSTTASDIDGGKTYLSTMEDNLSVLKQALN